MVVKDFNAFHILIFIDLKSHFQTVSFLHHGLLTMD